MTKLKASFVVALAAFSVASFGQAWRTAYESGLQAAGQNNWSAARTAFKQAAAYRPEDVSNPTLLPGPPSEQRKWRDGAPYSPNFLAAYSEYRLAFGTNDPEQRRNLLNTAATEFEALITKKQVSAETVYFLDTAYAQTGNTERRQALANKVANTPRTWRVDASVVAPEELAAISQASGPTTQAGPPAIVKAEDLNKVAPTVNAAVVTTNANPVVSAVGVAPIATKYALIIGNSTSRLSDANLSFAADDAQQVREALVTNAGYPDTNIELVLNGTASQMLASAKALADRMPEEATILIYFAGVGENVGGKDYLAGIDTEIPTDTSSMLGKAEVYRLFMAKGAHIFAFFQANRPTVNGRYFGAEVPMVGRIAQMQGTLPGANVFSYVRNGKTVGVFTDAVVGVLNELKSNEIPITEFGWQVFYRIRRGDTGTTGGGSQQTSTLPGLTNMASDARF